jgi:hypothetical protein
MYLAALNGIIYLLPAVAFHGIAGCVTHLYVPIKRQQGKELFIGSLFIYILLYKSATQEKRNSSNKA